MTSSANAAITDVEAGRVLAAFIEALVREQEERKTSLESRGAAVLTSSGVIASLLIGLVAFLTGAQDFTLPGQADLPLTLALVFFTVAAGGGVVCNVPVPYEGVSLTDVAATIADDWGTYSEAEALQLTSVTRVKRLASAKRWNHRKGMALFFAQTLEVLAVAALALAVLQILAHS